MATYKEIRGTQIEAVATDPSNPVEGQVWYNTTSNVLKGLGATTAGSWATTNSLNQPREALAAAGSAPASTSLVYLGFNNPTKYAQTELFNGTNWTELNDANTARANAAGFGISTAAIAAGGYLGPPGSTAIVESWNGTNWTEVNDLNQHKYTSGGAGTSTAGLIFGGGTTPPYGVLDETETWNGTNWTEVNDMTTGRQTVGSAGIYTSALAAGGNTGTPSNKTETWNGTNWTEEGDLNTARYNLEGGGTTSSAVMAGGDTGSISGASEEWTGAGPVTRTFTDS